MLLLAGGLVLCGNAEDTVGIDIEAYLDLRDSTGCGSDSVEMEYADLLVVLRHRTLALENADLY